MLVPLKRIQNLNIQIDLQLYLYDHLFHLLRYIVVRYGALKIAKLLKFYMAIFLRQIVVYVTCSICDCGIS